MKTKTLFLLAFTGFIINSYSWTPDTTKLFWNRDLIIEFDYGYSFVSMYRLNKYYIDDWAKEMGLFNKEFHTCTFATPSIGLVFTNNIINLSASFSKYRLKGNVTTAIDNSSFTPYLFVDLWAINASYRRMIEFKLFLIGIGTTASFGKGSADVGTISIHELNVQEERLVEGYGVGGSLFGEFDYILFKYIIIGIKLSGNIFITKTLESKDFGKWVVNENGKEINLNYTGLSALAKVGFLW